MSLPLSGRRLTFRNRGIMEQSPSYQQLANDLTMLSAGDGTSVGSPETLMPKRSDFATIGKLLIQINIQVIGKYI
jgi:hypothetical protein